MSRKARVIAYALGMAAIGFLGTAGLSHIAGAENYWTAASVTGGTLLVYGLVELYPKRGSR